MTSKQHELFHLRWYNHWVQNWQKDMEKHYGDKRRVIKRRVCE